MPITKTVKSLFSTFAFLAGAWTLYSYSNLEKKYSAVKRDNRRLTGEVYKLKKELSDMKKHNNCTEPTDVKICECQRDNVRKYTHTVKEYNGIIGVFDGEGTLVREIDVTVDSLPDADKQDLMIGIRVYSSDELDRILEEFN